MRFLPWRRPRSDGTPSRRVPGSTLPSAARLSYATHTIWQAVAPWLSVVLLAALVTVPLGSFLWLLFATDAFVVRNITIVDAREHTAIAVRELAETELTSVAFNRNIFFVHGDLIESRISAALPQVHTVHIVRKLPDTLKIIVQEKTPALLLLSGNQYYLVDAAGVPYEAARLDTLPGVVLPTVKNSDPDSTVTLGVPAVAASLVSFVQYVQEHLPEHVDAHVAETKIPSLAAREVHFVLDTNWQLRFDVTRDPGRQLEILQRVIDEIVTEAERPVLEYIDLRIPNRVYYKTRNVGNQ